jgi:hypothetical protein
MCGYIDLEYRCNFMQKKYRIDYVNGEVNIIYCVWLILRQDEHHIVNSIRKPQAHTIFFILADILDLLLFCSWCYMYLYLIYYMIFIEYNNYILKGFRHNVIWCKVGIVCVEYVCVIEYGEDCTTVNCVPWCFLPPIIYRKENINITLLSNLSRDLLQ